MNSTPPWATVTGIKQNDEVIFYGPKIYSAASSIKWVNSSDFDTALVQTVKSAMPRPSCVGVASAATIAASASGSSPSWEWSSQPLADAGLLLSMLVLTLLAWGAARWWRRVRVARRRRRRCEGARLRSGAKAAAAAAAAERRRQRARPRHPRLRRPHLRAMIMQHQREGQGQGQGQRTEDNGDKGGLVSDDAGEWGPVPPGDGGMFDTLLGLLGLQPSDEELVIDEDPATKASATVQFADPASPSLTAAGDAAGPPTPPPTPPDADDAEELARSLRQMARSGTRPKKTLFTNVEMNEHPEGLVTAVAPVAQPPSELNTAPDVLPEFDSRELQHRLIFSEAVAVTPRMDTIAEESDTDSDSEDVSWTVVEAVRPPVAPAPAAAPSVVTPSTPERTAAAPAPTPNAGGWRGRCGGGGGGGGRGRRLLWREAAARARRAGALRSARSMAREQRKWRRRWRKSRAKTRAGARKTAPNPQERVVEVSLIVLLALVWLLARAERFAHCAHGLFLLPWQPQPCTPASLFALPPLCAP